MGNSEKPAKPKLRGDAVLQNSLYELLRAGVEFLGPAAEESSARIELASVVAALELDDGSHGRGLSWFRRSKPSPSDNSAYEDRLQEMERQIILAKTELVDREKQIEKLQLQIRKVGEEPRKKVAKKVKVSGADKVESILGEFERSKREIEEELNSTVNLDQFHQARLESRLEQLNRRRDEITNLFGKMKDKSA